MERLENAAGRLHAILSRYREAAAQNKSIWQTWHDVFDTELDNVRLLPLLGHTAGLIGEIEVAVVAMGDPAAETLFDTYSDTWAASIWAPGHNHNTSPSPGPNVVDAPALASLGVLASLIAAHGSQISLPDDQQQADLKADVLDLLDALQADDTLPTELLQVLSQRMHDVLWAIDHIALGGPDAVAAAMERLVGQIVLLTAEDPQTRREPMFTRVMDVAMKTWHLFALGTKAEAAIASWTRVYRVLGGGGE